MRCSNYIAVFILAIISQIIRNRSCHEGHNIIRNSTLTMNKKNLTKSTTVNLADYASLVREGKWSGTTMSVEKFYDLTVQGLREKDSRLKQINEALECGIKFRKDTAYIENKYIIPEFIASHVEYTAIETVFIKETCIQTMYIDKNKRVPRRLSVEFERTIEKCKRTLKPQLWPKSRWSVFIRWLLTTKEWRKIIGNKESREKLDTLRGEVLKFVKNKENRTEVHEIADLFANCVIEVRDFVTNRENLAQKLDPNMMEKAIQQIHWLVRDGNNSASDLCGSILVKKMQCDAIRTF